MQPPTLDVFQTLVEQAIATLPAEILAMMDNISVVVAERPTLAQRTAVKLRDNHELYGLYQGTPLTRRGAYYGMTPPDIITIFMYPMVLHHHTEATIQNQVRRTVLHEIGHHFGLGEADLQRLGY